MKHSRANKVRALLGVLIGAVFVYLVMHNIDYARVSALLDRARLLPIVLAFVAFVVDFLLRAVRFWMMLRLTTHRALPLLPTIAPFIASFGISDILPLRVGDGLRVFWFSRQFQIPAGTVVGTMIVERILDLLTIVMIGGVALALLDMSVPSAIMRNFQIALIVAVAAGLVLLIAPAILSRIVQIIVGKSKIAAVEALVGILQSTSSAVAQIGSWQRVMAFIAISLALWLLESLVMLGAWLSLGGSLSDIQQPFAAFAFSILGTLVPSLPGHFGAFEFFGLQAFSLAGVETSFATAVLLLTHLILWAPTALFGIAWLIIGRHQARESAG